MYTAKKKVLGHEYLQVLESFRMEGKPTHRVVMHVGPYASVQDALERMSDQDKLARLRELVKENPGLAG